MTKTSKSKSRKPKTVVKSKDSKSVKTKKTPVVVKEKTPVVVEEVVKTVVKKGKPTPESVLEEFDELVNSLEEEVARLREDKKASGVKYLRSLGKRLKTLRNRTNRAMKKKRTTKRVVNTNSGFLKPVKISKEMAKFTGWDQSELKSRVDVTKYICKYIKDNDLQNPTDRRQILADTKLAKLLEYNPKSDQPLTYYSIQSHIKKHFVC